MCLHRCSDKRKCRDFFSGIASATGRRPHPPKADRRYENYARRLTDVQLGISLTNSLRYYHQLGLPGKYQCHPVLNKH